MAELLYMAINRLKRRGSRLLTKGSRFFKTDLFYLTKGSFWLSVGKVASVIFGIVLSVAFANLLPKEAFGTYQFILALGGIVSFLTMTGLTTGIIRAVARGEEGALRAGFLSYLKWSTGIALGGLTLAVYCFWNGNATLAAAFLIVGALAPFMESFSVYYSFLIGKKNFKDATFLGAWRKPIPVIAIIATLFLTDNVLTLVLVYFLSHTITAGLVFLRVWQKYRPSGEVDRQALLGYSKHLSVINLLTKVVENLDRILLFHFVGPVEVAVYTFARMPQKYLVNLTGILKTLAFPKLSEQRISVLKRTLPIKLSVLFLVLTGVTAAYIAAAPFLFSLLFPQYLDSVFFSQILALLVLFTPLSVLKSVFTAHGRKREMYVLSVGGQIMRVSLLLVLLPLYGIWGAVAALLATPAVTGVAAIYLFARIKDLPEETAE